MDVIMTDRSELHTHSETRVIPCGGLGALDEYSHPHGPRDRAAQYGEQIVGSVGIETQTSHRTGPAARRQPRLVLPTPSQESHQSTIDPAVLIVMDWNLACNNRSLGRHGPLPSSSRPSMDPLGEKRGLKGTF
jgi:hypothetical protein